MTWLLDGNVLVALATDTHVFHDRVSDWFDALTDRFATCAVTEGTLLRVRSMRCRSISIGVTGSVITRFRGTRSAVRDR